MAHKKLALVMELRAQAVGKNLIYGCACMHPGDWSFEILKQSLLACVKMLDSEDLENLQKFGKL